MMMVMAIAFIIAHMGIIYASGIFDGYAYMDAYQEIIYRDFINEALNIHELVFVFISIFITIHLASLNNQALMIYTIYSRENKFKFIVSRMITGMLIITFIVITSWLFIEAFITQFTPFIHDRHSTFLVYLYLLFEVIQYMILTYVFMMIFNYMLMGLMSFLLFWIYEIIDPKIMAEHFKFVQYVTINVKSTLNYEKNLLIFALFYIFLVFSYIIVLMKKDC
jgi:hypothetical protein